MGWILRAIEVLEAQGALLVGMSASKIADLRKTVSKTAASVGRAKATMHGDGEGSRGPGERVDSAAERPRKWQDVGIYELRAYNWNAFASVELST